MARMSLLLGLVAVSGIFTVVNGQQSTARQRVVPPMPARENLERAASPAGAEGLD
jgi:hypothetical protein